MGRDKLLTVRASSMKMAMKRRPSDSGSDDGIRSHTNRGNKLKRDAKFVQQGHLDHTGGLAYKKVADGSNSVAHSPSLTRGRESIMPDTCAM